MDTNDYRPSGPDGADKFGSDPQEIQQPGVYYNAAPPNNREAFASNGGYYGSANRGSGSGGRKSRKAAALLVAFVMLVCLALGGILTAYVIMPGIYPSLQNDSNVAQLPPVQSDEPAGGLNNDSSGEQASLTTDSPEIGGKAPGIDYSQSPIIQIAKEVGPTVVGVAVSQQTPSLGYGVEEREYGYGTGFIITADGYIVTNNHVISGSHKIMVTLSDGKDYEARLVGTDVTTDLAVIKIEASGLVPGALGNSDELQVGETVVAIGNPLGSELAGSVTSGIVSALNREISTNSFSQKYIQTDAAINPGNSGGPLVNLKGEVIGINTLKTYLAGYDDYGVPIGTEGIGFAIPITSARPLIEQLITKGSVERPGIGITCLVDLTNAYNPEGAPEGVTVIKVSSDGPADLAGIEPHDIITSIEGTPVKTVEELTGKIQSYKVGDELNMTVWRAGQEYKAKVKVGDLNKLG